MTERGEIVIPLEETEDLVESSSLKSFVCSLCCDEISSSDSIVLTICGHQGCKSCMIKWIEKQEATGRLPLPTCPFCRSKIGEDETLAILGRVFKQRGRSTQQDHEVEVDELTLQWINNWTTPCPACGSRIEKTDGCNHMTCLCGYEFCYRCGDARCHCNGRNFRYTARETPLRDNNGVVNLRWAVNRRLVRAERARRREESAVEAEIRWKHVDDCDPFECKEKLSHRFACDGEWMFSRRKRLLSWVGLIERYHAALPAFASADERKREE